MSNPTIAALLGGGATALCETTAMPLLAATVPDGFSAAITAQDIDPSDRYVVQQGVAIVPVRGLMTANNFQFERYMGWTTYHGLVETLAALSADDDITAIVIEGDSPGGVVVGIDAAVDAIAAAAAIKPVHALVNPSAVSAAYWLLCQASDITMTAGGQVGSIGVQYSGSAPIETGMHGDRGFVFRSSNARAKNPDPSTDTGQALILAQLDKFEAAFHAAIVAGRNIPAGELTARLSVTDDPVDGGATFGFADAQARGLVDAQATRNDFYASIFDRYATDEPRRKSLTYGARATAAIALAAT